MLNTQNSGLRTESSLREQGGGGTTARSKKIAWSKGFLVGKPRRRGARVADWARLEIVCAPNTGTEGSNPSLSAVSGDS